MGHRAGMASGGAPVPRPSPRRRLPAARAGTGSLSVWWMPLAALPPRSPPPSPPRSRCALHSPHRQHVSQRRFRTGCRVSALLRVNRPLSAVSLQSGRVATDTRQMAPVCASRIDSPAKFRFHIDFIYAAAPARRRPCRQYSCPPPLIKAYTTAATAKYSPGPSFQNTCRACQTGMACPQLRATYSCAGALPLSPYALHIPSQEPQHTIVRPFLTTVMAAQSFQHKKY
jgi:hypothetical protein